MKNIKKIRLIVLLLFSVQIAFSQELPQRKMTIHQLADSLVANNIQIKLADAAVQIADAKIGEVKTNRLPNLNATMVGMYLSV